MTEPTHSFTPFWLMSLPEEERRVVQGWLSAAGVNLDLCPGFDYDGRVVTTRYYQTNAKGEALMGPDGPEYSSDLHEYRPGEPPSVVQDRMRTQRYA